MQKKKIEPLTERQQLQAVARQLGRALSLTAIATFSSSGTEDQAIEAMDRAWVRLADLIVDFAEETA